MFRRVLVLLAALYLGGCAETPPYVYNYVPGRTATLENGCAVAPPQAPADVQAAVAAGNRINGSPYAFGAGHAQSFDEAYDCSGATSFVLQAAGKLDSPTTSRGFRHYGERGTGDWISVYARRGHVFLVVAGLRFDTSQAGETRGPHWTTHGRQARGYVIRHPSDL